MHKYPAKVRKSQKLIADPCRTPCGSLCHGSCTLMVESSKRTERTEVPNVQKRCLLLLKVQEANSLVASTRIAQLVWSNENVIYMHQKRSIVMFKQVFAVKRTPLLAVRIICQHRLSYSNTQDTGSSSFKLRSRQLMWMRTIASFLVESNFSKLFIPWNSIP